MAVPVEFHISEVSERPAVRESARIIRASFKTVADEFGFNRTNCPTHSAFTTVRKLNEFKNKGARLFGGFLGASQIGFVAIEKANQNVYYMERVAVLPLCRHHGYGEKLVRFSIDYVKSNGGNKISIGTVNEHKL